MDMGAIIIVVAVVVFAYLVLIIAYASRVMKVPPDQVLVISGRERIRIDPLTKKKTNVGYRMIQGGRTFVWPVIERADIISLELMTIEVRVKDVYTSQGVPITLDGVAQIKIASDEVSIVAAVERFLSKTRREVMEIAHETLACHFRAIVGALTVEEIYRDRDAFAQRVQEVSAGDLANMGLSIDSFVIKDIQDGWDYLEALGRPRAAEVNR